MKMTKALFVAFMVLVPLAMQQAWALEAGGPQAGGPEASDVLVPQVKSVLDCLDALVEHVHSQELYAIMAQGKGLMEFGCKVLADQPVCLDALGFVLGLAEFDAGVIHAACGLPGISPAYAPIPSN